MKALKLKKIILDSTLFVGVLLPVCFGQSVQAFASVDWQIILSQEESTLDFWGDKNALSNVLDFNYTTTGIHIKTTEHILNTIKTSSDCDVLAQQALDGFKQKNGVSFKRNLQSVSNEIYFHVQMEKYARMNNNLETHTHTNIIDMEQNEAIYDSLIDPDMTDIITEGYISDDYDEFIKNYIMDDILSKAKVSVSEAETEKTQDSVNDANKLLDELEDSEEKSSLVERINVLQTYINKLNMELTAVSTLDSITVDNGTILNDIDLPNAVSITLKNNTTIDAAITWDTSSYNKNVAGTYKFTGTLTLPDGVSNPNNLTANINVTVGQANETPINKSVASISNLDDINIDYGTTLSDIGLPNNVDVTLSDSTTTSAAVTWTGSNPIYNQYESGSYKFTGKLDLPNDVENPNNLKVDVNVIVGKIEKETTGAAARVVIDGTPKEDETLVADLLDKDGVKFTTSAAVTYKWYSLDNLDSDFNNLVGEDKDYKVSKNDVGKYIGVYVKTAKDYFTAVVGKVLGTSSDNNQTGGNNNNNNDDGALLNTVYDLIKEKLNAINYTNSTTKESIVSNLNAITLPNNISVSIIDSKLTPATYSASGTFTLNIKLESKNGGSKTLDYVGNISKLTSSSSGHSSGGSGHSSGSSSGSSSNSNDNSSTNVTTTTSNADNDVKTTSNSNGTQTIITTTPIVTLTASHDATQIKANEGAKVVTTPLGGVVQVPTDKKAWVADNGTWFLFDKGNQATGWNQVDSKWYYLNNTGAMQTGWVKDTNGSWYYLDSNGSMKTGWLQNSDGNWYYLNSDGAMAANTTVDGYILDETGKWV